MSRARTRANQNWEKGAVERRDWNPEPGSAHYRVYRWWMHRARKRPAHENFCHYWRVVLIWAPLRWLIKPLLGLVAIAALVAIVWAAVTFTSTVIGIVIFITGTALVLLYVVYCTAVAAQLLHEVDSREFDVDEVSWLDNKSFTVKALATLSALPVLLVAGAFCLVVGSVVAVFIGLHEDHDFYAKSGRWFFGAHFGNSKWTSWIRPWLSLPLLALMLSLFFDVAREVSLWILFGIAYFVVIGSVIFLLSFLVDKYKLRSREMRRETLRQHREAAIDQMLQVMFEVAHPESVDDNDRFAEWRANYERDWLVLNDQQVYDSFPQVHISYLPPDVRQQVVARLIELGWSQHGSLADVGEFNESSRLVTFIVSTLESIGDYLSLIWSVILTRKWKICPRVELPD